MGDLLKRSAALAVLLAAVGAIGAANPWLPGEALAEGKPKLETLLDTDTTNLGQPLVYPEQGAPRITAVIVTLEPGQETGRHRHPVPLFGHVLAGEVTIDYGAHGSKTYRAGDAFMEAVDTWHNGRNTGEDTLRILAVFMGAEGAVDVERP